MARVMSFVARSLASTSPSPLWAGRARALHSSRALCLAKSSRRGGSFLPFIGGQEDAEAPVSMPLPPEPAPTPFTGHSAERDPAKRAEAIAAALPLVTRVSRSLDEVAKLDLFAQKTAAEVSELWRSYHAARYCIAAVIESAQYAALRARWAAYPLFVLPLPRGEGVEFFVAQFSPQEDLASFTPLGAYQREGAAASRGLTMKHYTELTGSHSLVLMRGEIDPHIIDVQEAQLLANQFQLFYLDAQRYALVKRFHEQPHTFDYSALLEFNLPKDDVAPTKGGS